MLKTNEESKLTPKVWISCFGSSYNGSLYNL